jgi:hypothetical protein
MVEMLQDRATRPEATALLQTATMLHIKTLILQTVPSIGELKQHERQLKNELQIANQQVANFQTSILDLQNVEAGIRNELAASNNLRQRMEVEKKNREQETKEVKENIQLLYKNIFNREREKKEMDVKMKELELAATKAKDEFQIKEREMENLQVENGHQIDHLKIQINFSEEEIATLKKTLEEQSMELAVLKARPAVQSPHSIPPNSLPKQLNFIEVGSSEPIEPPAQRSRSRSPIYPVENIEEYPDVRPKIPEPLLIPKEFIQNKMVLRKDGRKDGFLTLVGDPIESSHLANWPENFHFQEKKDVPNNLQATFGNGYNEARKLGPNIQKIAERYRISEDEINLSFLLNRSRFLLCTLQVNLLYF